MRRGLLVLLGAGALAACGFHAVKVRHFALGEKLAPEATPALKRVLVVMRLEPPPKPVLGSEGTVGDKLKTLFKKAAQGEGSLPLDRGRAQELLGQCAQALRSPYSGLAGTVVLRGEEALPSLAKGLEPSAILWLEPGRLRASSEKKTVTRKLAAKDGQPERTVQEDQWEAAARFQLKWRLEAGGRSLAEGSHEGAASAVFSEAPDLKSWLESKSRDLTGGWPARLSTDLLPHPVQRVRQLRKGESDAEKAAFDAAKKGDWAAAVAAWEAGAAGGSWVAAHNLGVRRESEGRFGEAADWYRKARASAARPAQEALDVWLNQLERLAALPAELEAAAAPGWYEEPVAVLPFTNESVHVEAPELLREQVRASLAAGGYKAVELEGLDQRLREAGVTEGAHLASLKPSQAAKAAGAKRLLYGEVEAFGMLNVGLYRRRHVRLKLRLTDERGRELWSSYGEGFREDAVEPKDAAVGFGLGVAEKLLERATRSFLEDESKEAVRIALETLPRLPAAPPGS